MRELLEPHGEEGAQDQSGEAAAGEALHGLLGAEHDEGRGAEEEAGHVGHDVVDGDDGHGEDVPDHAVAEGEVEEVTSPDKIEHGQVSQPWSKDKYSPTWLCSRYPGGSIETGTGRCGE